MSPDVGQVWRDERGRRTLLVVETPPNKTFGRVLALEIKRGRSHGRWWLSQSQLANFTLVYDAPMGRP